MSGPYSNSQPVNAGAGTGDHGETWDPTGGPDGKGAWIPAPVAQSGVNPTPAAPTGYGGYSNADANPINGAASLNGSYDTSGATLGKVRPFNGVNSGGAWGGYSGTMVDNGSGGARFDASQSGRAEAVNRARGLGAAAANQQAPQINYGAADGFAGAGQNDRSWQSDAMGVARDTAMGNNLQSQALGQQMLRQGVQAQQAGAASSRGGSLAQAAAMRQQAAGQGSFMQQGNNQLAAQRAAEMAQGRDQYMGLASSMRASDAAAQQMNQNQGLSQMNQELGQRDLNQQGWMGYEAQGQSVNQSAADAALKADEMQHGIDSAASLRAQQQADRQFRNGAALAGAGGTLFASGSGVFGNSSPSPTPAPAGGSPGEAQPLDPYSEQVSNSDIRGKTNVTSLASAALRQRGMR